MPLYPLDIVLEMCISTISSVINTPQSAESTFIAPEAKCFSVNAKYPERIVRLFEALKSTRGSLNAEQFTCLKKIIASNTDLFALDNTELGHRLSPTPCGHQ